MNNNTHTAVFEKYIFFVLLLTPLIVPLFFVPGGIVSFYASKIVLVSLVALVSAILYALTVFKKKMLSIPHVQIMTATLALVVVYVLSAVFSSSLETSVFGYGFETLAVMSVFILSVIFFITASTFQSVERIVTATLAFLFSALILGLLHTTRFIFGADVLSLGFLDNVVANTIGSPNELAIFFGAAAILSVAVLEGLKLRNVFRVFSYIVLVLSVILLVIVNFNMAWYVVAGCSLITALYFSGVLTRGSRKIPYKALALCVIALIFSIPAINARINTFVHTLVPADFVDVRPSVQATLQVGRDSLSANPIFGVGPNRFRNEWELYRPDVNSTTFWNYSFGASYGFVPTAMIETGLVGIIAWLAFLLTFVWLCVRIFMTKTPHQSSSFMLISSSVVALYFWFMDIVYSPGWPILALTFFFTGLTVASAVTAGVVKSRAVVFDARKYLSPLLLSAVVVILIIILGSTGVIFKKTYAASQFIRASVEFSKTGNIEIAASALERAIALDDSDVYYRNAGEIDLLKINALVAEVDKDASAIDRVRADLQKLLTHIIDVSNKAIQKDQDNFTNWLAAARVYATIAPLGLPDAYDLSIKLYDEALKRSPKNPLIYLELARLEVGRKGYTKARGYIEQSLNLKPNYTESIFLLSQIDVTEGKNNQAIASTEKIAQISPNDPSIFFRLGLLKYGEKDYKGAITAFERALVLVPEYANAEYFLGLSYYYTNRVTDSIKRFEHVAAANPDNAELKFILGNLKAGRAPFTGVQPPLDSKPEKRDELPVKETPTPSRSKKP